MFKKGAVLTLTIILYSITFFTSINVTEAKGFSNNPIHWGFSKSKNHVPPFAGTEYEALLKKHDSFYLGDTKKKNIYLTFDNGYENGYTDDILNVLKEKKVPAIFFVTGHYLKDQPDLVKRMVNEGHIVGNHSWHHPDLTSVSDERLKKELEKVKTEFTNLTGEQEMRYLRAPRGIFSDRTLALSKEMGYINVFWSLAFKDWNVNQQKGWKYAYDNITKQIHPGAVILLHTVSKDNADALEKVIDDLQKEGYQFKSIDELMLEREFDNPFRFQSM